MTVKNIPAHRKNSVFLLCAAAFCLLLIGWKTALWLHLPLPSVDGVQSLSHTYSLLRGDFLHSIFLHHWMEIYQLPYGYGVATAPVMALLPFGTVNNFFAASLIFALAPAAAAGALLATAPARHSRGFTALVALALFLYPHFWIMRPESITVFLLLLCLLLLRGYPQRPRRGPLLASAFFVVFAGLTHPLAGLIGILLVTLMALETRWGWKHLIGFYALAALFLALLYLPIILLDVNLWVENFLGFFTREEPRGFSAFVDLRTSLPRFLVWGAPLLLLYLAAIARSGAGWRSALLRDALFGLLFAVPVVVAGKGAYYTYLLVFIIWRLAFVPRALSVPAPLAVLVLVVAPLWTHYFPTFQNLENPRYGENVRAIMQQVDAYSGRGDAGMIWVSSQLGMPLIDERYARIILNYYAVRRYPQPVAVEAGDEFLYQWADEARVIFENYTVTPDNTETEVLVEPVPGLLTFESLLRERLPDIGLWRITVR